MYRACVAQGEVRPDVVMQFKAFIAESARALTRFDLDSAFPHLQSSTKQDVEGAIRDIIGREGFYLFIDDTDQVARPGVAGHLNRVSALALAVRRPAYDIPNLHAIISLRTEVWHRMQRDDYGQRDQTDHFRRLIVNMHTDREGGVSKSCWREGVAGVRAAA